MDTPSLLSQLIWGPDKKELVELLAEKGGVKIQAMTTILHNRNILRTYCQGVVTTYGRKEKKLSLEDNWLQAFPKGLPPREVLGAWCRQGQTQRRP